MSERETRRTPSAALLTRDVDADERISTVVVRSVASISNTEITDLPPLYDAIEPDALDAVFRSGRQRGRVRFRYSGYLVVVEPGTSVAIYDTAANE